MFPKGSGRKAVQDIPAFFVVIGRVAVERQHQLYKDGGQEVAVRLFIFSHQGEVSPCVFVVLCKQSMDKQDV